MLADVISVLSVPSFAIIVVQGVVGSAPWNALVFNILYLQLLGMTDFQASAVASAFLLGTAVGAQVGGAVGDWAAAKSPAHGRILTSQFSVGVGVPLALVVYKASSFSFSFFIYFYLYILCAGVLVFWLHPIEAQNRALFPSLAACCLRAEVTQCCIDFLFLSVLCGMPQLLPVSPLVVWLYGATFALWGLLVSWAGPACTSPVFAEIVPSQLRAVTYSFDRVLEGNLLDMIR
jgi:hypothetical protein